MPGHGGKRPGAGRKVGARTQASIAREKRVAETGITPLEVMLECMRDAHHEMRVTARSLAQARKPEKKAELKLELRERRQQANDIAKDVAPYVHPKLQSVLHGGDASKPVRLIHDVSDATLTRMASFIRSGIVPTRIPQEKPNG